MYVQHNADRYGASRSLVRLVQHLDRKRFQPLVVMGEDGPLRAELEALNTEVIVETNLSILRRHTFASWRGPLAMMQIPLSALSLWRLIRKHRIDLVHTNSGIVISSGLAARLARVPHVWHFREWFQEFAAIWPFYSAYMRWSSQKIIAVSEAIAQQFRQREKVVVIHNGFSLDEFAVDQPSLANDFRARHNLGNEFVVGCVGRIKSVRKGQEFLIDAAARLKQRSRRAKYLIIGSPFPGNEQHLVELQRRIRELRLEDSVVLTGDVNDVRPAYAAMDVLVLPSAQPEPFSGVVMEAMAMGVPVIATRLGGSIDQVADRVTGFLVPPADPDSLAEKIEALMTDPDLRGRMSRAGPRRIIENFSIKDMVKKIESVYSESCGLLVEGQRSQLRSDI